MYAIETDLGRFEADTERDAKRKLRAAKKKQDAIDIEASRKYQAAILKASSQAYCLYERKGRGEEMPRGWMYFTDTATTFRAVRQTARGDYHERGYEIETSDGKATAFPYDDIVGFVENGAGFCMAVAIANQDCELFAVGVFEDRVAWLPLYGISVCEFNPSKHSNRP